MPYSHQDIQSKLMHKFGFSLNEKRGHLWFTLELPDLPVISTMLSHGRKEIGRSLESQIARQLGVRTPFFREMMNCTKSREEYYRQLQTTSTDYPVPSE